MPTSAESEIRSRLEKFATDLAALIRESAVGTVEAAFGGSVSGRPRVSRSSAVARAPGRGAKKGQKRDPNVLQALTEKLGAFIAKNPGQRIEQIGKALGVATKELALPVKKLIGAKRVSTKGQKRATTYFAGGGRGGKRGPKPGNTGKVAARKRKRLAKRAPKRATTKKATKATSARPAAPKTEATPTAAE